MWSRFKSVLTATTVHLGMARPFGTSFLWHMGAKADPWKGRQIVREVQEGYTQEFETAVQDILGFNPAGLPDFPIYSNWVVPKYQKMEKHAKGWEIGSSRGFTGDVSTRSWARKASPVISLGQFQSGLEGKVECPLPIIDYSPFSGTRQQVISACVWPTWRTKRGSSSREGLIGQNMHSDFSTRMEDLSPKIVFGPWSEWHLGMRFSTRGNWLYRQPIGAKVSHHLREHFAWSSACPLPGYMGLGVSSKKEVSYQTNGLFCFHSCKKGPWRFVYWIVTVFHENKEYTKAYVPYARIGNNLSGHDRIWDKHNHDEDRKEW